MSEAFQQGQADGLCGLYSIPNFLTTIPGWKKQRSTKKMEYILEAVQAEGVLTPSCITNGYRDAEIKSILNRLFTSWWMDFEAFRLCEVQRTRGESTYDLCRRVLAAGGAVIGGSDARSHWLLLAMIDGEESVVDSSNSSNPIRPFDGRSRSLCSEESVVILPRNRRKVEIES